MTFPHTATVKRQSKTGTKYSYGTIGTISCFLQPLDEQESEAYGITFMKGSRCYVMMTADVEEGDRLTIGDTTYGVKGLRIHNYGSMRHKRLALEELG